MGWVARQRRRAGRDGDEESRLRGGAAPGGARPTRTCFFADWPFTRWTLTLDGRLG